ncbi:MAG: DNA mismatch repair endonuclease MutL [Butyricicoccus sp.]|nr:DNA mismatch repair endonuclease MutL [Butyricicoccus sp.]
MSVINILSPHVADMIAAGEVVERPASVVKELVENSIDAGAHNITVEINGGGMSLIRVTDDGRGMSPDDAGIAFQRHATSKLRGERDLESISTLGFRGEALAAISAVSRVELLTRERGSGTGTRVLLTAGEIDEMGPSGCPEGTVMSVRALFHNTPARQKFMKSDRAEGSACAAMALRCALGRPEVSVRLIRDGQEVFFTPGDGVLKSAVYTLLGRENAMNMLDCSGENGGVRVHGCVTAPHAGRGSRAMQFFFINGRSFKSTSIQAALEQAYKNTLLTGRFPGCVLYIELPFARVDVNVHPAKTEVKFTDEKLVFDAVYAAVRSALGLERSTAEIRLTPAPEAKPKPDPKPDFYRSMSAEQFRALASAPARKGASYPRGSGTPNENMRMTLRQSGDSAYPRPPAVPAPPPVPAPPSVPAPPPVPTPPIPEPEPADEPLIPDFRVIGEAMNTYIIVESGEELLLIDKHAAHERMIFDALKRRPGELMSQTLMVPVTFSPGAGDVELILDNLPLLSQAGFEIEPYGQDSVIIRAVPADTDGDERALLEELCEKLRRGHGLDGRRDALLHTIACKAAIKAGWRTDESERRIIAEKVLSGEVRYCPHGRPVSVKLTRKELDKQFKRIT